MSTAVDEQEMNESDEDSNDSTRMESNTHDDMRTDTESRSVRRSTRRNAGTGVQRMLMDTKGKD